MCDFILFDFEIMLIVHTYDEAMLLWEKDSKQQFYKQIVMVC